MVAPICLCLTPLAGELKGSLRVTLSEFDLRRKMTRLRLFPRLARSMRKRYIRLIHGDKYFITKYFGARFLVCWTDVVGREIALRNFERIQLKHLIGACERLKPDAFIDVGANCGLYSCVLLKQGVVPWAILFEPDRRNLLHLRANLLLNGLVETADWRDCAVGSVAGRLRLVPGHSANTGKSRIADKAEAGAGYEVNVIPLDQAVPLVGKTLAIKMDVEGHELHALAGMTHLLRENRGIVQIETKDTRGEVVRIMRSHGYVQVADFYFDVVFEKC